MEMTVNGIRLHLRREGAGPAIVFLHGWGAHGGNFDGLIQAFRGSHDCIALDLPGFGGSTPPPAAWSSEEYAALVEAALDQLGLKNPILAGHSFGGKVAIRLAARGRASRLILFGSAGIRPRRAPAWYVKVYGYKTVKLLARIPGFRPLFGDIAERMKRRTGSADYRAATGVMRDSLVRAVNEDVRHLLPAVACPTLLVWGRNDTATPVADAELMKSRLPDAGLVVLEKAGHYVFIDQPAATRAVLTSFLQPAGVA